MKRPGSDLPLILSCFHVLADFGRGETGDLIEQPLDGLGAIDPNNVIGSLIEPSLPLDPFGQNEVDAALAKVADAVSVDPEIPDIGKPTGIKDLSQQDFATFTQLQLVRNGARTNRQDGTLDSVKATLSVFDESSGRRITFRNVVVYDSRCEAGDSGAAVLERDTNKVVGLHFGGTGSQGFFIHIQTIFDKLNVELF